jgi:hypothetical protein
MTPTEVRTAVAETEVYEEWMGGNLNDSLTYRGLILQFDSCDAYGPLADAKLAGMIIDAAHRGEILLWGERLPQWGIEQLRTTAAAAGVVLEPGITHDRLYSRAHRTEFTFDSDGRLERISV